jgi:all-trans-8'-apo-beta-carotenal 15,15'-oxygenase
MILKAGCRPDSGGRIPVEFRRIETPLDRIRQGQPDLFRTNGVSEVSPFGFSNFANTNLQLMEGRLFVGYDVGRPIEVDPETLATITPVGSNAEWLQTLPAAVEPMIAIGAHPGPAWDEGALYFANYELIPLSNPRGMRICRWGLEGPVEHWTLEDIPPFDSIHDVKVTRDYIVICDLPFVTEMGPPSAAPRRAVADIAQLWIIRKADLRSHPAGSSVPFRHLTVPMMGGHIAVDYDNRGSEIVVYIAHHPITDLGMEMTSDDVSHATGESFHPDYLGLNPVAMQPSGIGRYRIDAEEGRVLEHVLASDPGLLWGSTLFTQNLSNTVSRNEVKNLWFTSLGFDPELVSERWWQTYAEHYENVFVAPRDFPREPIPGHLARIDTEAMKIADVYSYPLGSFAHPPTFVPRIAAADDADGYVIVSVHRDGDKALEVFDARDLAAGPIASASAVGFNHPLLLHSTWSPPRLGPRPSSYRIDPVADAWATLQAFAASPGAGPGIAAVLFGT